MPSVLIAHPGADVYGSDRVMLETASAMRDRGWTVVTTVPAPGPLVAQVERRGAQVVFCPTPVLRKSALRPRAFLSLMGVALRSIAPTWRLVRSIRPDVVYVSTVTIPLWIILARLLRVPVVCHVHESERSASIWLRRLMLAPLLMTTSLVLNSRFSQAVLLESYPGLERRTVVIPNAVACPTHFRPARELPVAPLGLVFIGRLSERKGPQVAVDVLAALQARNVHARLDLVGSVFPGNEAFETGLRERIAALGVLDSVVLHGFASDVWDHLANADVVLVPSQGEETFGNIVVEAVMAGRPVIASAGSGLDEACAGFESARSVPAADLSGWVAAVDQVLVDWSRIRQQAAQDAEAAVERYAPERYRAAIADRVEAVASRRLYSDVPEAA